MSETILAAIIGLITTFGGAFAGWFFTRKKNNAEAEISELDGVEKAIKIWRETAESLLADVYKYQEDKRNLGDEISKLNDTITTLHAEVNKLKRINNRILCALRNITPENAKQVVDELNQHIEGHE